MANGLRITTGQMDFSGGVNSGSVTTIASPVNPNGLKRTQLAWMTNGTVRGGGIANRTGFQPLVQNQSWSGLYQGGWLYEPQGAVTGNPYWIVSIGGRIYQVRVDTDNSVVDLSAKFGLTNPANVEQAFFCQGEEFLIIQAGDYVTLPLFWDGTTLRRSGGVGGTNATPATIVIKNVNDAAHVGVVIPGGQGAQYAGISITGVASFVMPAVGATVTVTVSSITGAVPSTNFKLSTSATVFTPTGDLQVTASTASSNNTIAAELIAAGPMDYYMGRFWMAFGRTFFGSDIVKGPSGTAGAPYFKRDSILKMTESPVGLVGDGFSVPSNAGNIRAIFHTAELDTTLGQGMLYVGTRKSIYRITVPVTRTAWIATDNANNQPFQTVAQVRYGPVSDRSVVRINGDVFYQTLQPSITSLALSIRYFQQWSNRSISREENRVLAFNDRSLLHASTGIEFNNRILQSVMPFQTPVGIAHRGLAPLDLDVITTMQDELPPAWEGMIEGLDTLQLFEGDFGGLQRAFDAIVSRTSGKIELWEITQASRTDNGDNRVQRYFETPAHDWSDAGSSPFKLKQLETLELWIDKLYGSVEFEVYFRPDQHPCWIPWHAWKDCAARDCTEDLDAVSCDYPGTPYCEQYRATIMLPKPPDQCATTQKRGVNIAYQFQIKVVTRGSNRIRGLLLHAFPVEKRPFEGMPCATPVFFNIAYTATCPKGFTCDPVTVPAGKFMSSVSQADADSKAIVTATAAVQSNQVPVSWKNSTQTVNCPVGFVGSPVTITAGLYESVVSQADADAQAVAAGKALLVCHTAPNSIDDFESYTDQQDLNGLNGGTSWFAAWVSHGGTVYTLDTFEGYTSGADLNGLNGGVGWIGAWVSRGGPGPALDDFESYANTTNLNTGLNGGTNWTGNWVSRP